MTHNKEKFFNTKLYAIISCVAVAVFLILMCVVTFSSKYTAFYPDKLASAYVDTIVKTGDGYNAYKNTLVSKNVKYGDFIRENYITPVVERDIKTEGKAYSDECFRGEKTLNDDGSLSGELTKRMYVVYEELINTYGWDDYDSIFSKYIEKLTAVREEIFGDKFFNDEVFFTAFEANVSQYGASLTGTEDVFDENTGVQLTEESEGLYEKTFGEDYSLTAAVVADEEYAYSEYIRICDTKKHNIYGINTDEIKEVRKITVEVKTDKNEQVAVCEVLTVKIGMSWYVDNTVTDTAALYDICK